VSERAINADKESLQRGSKRRKGEGQDWVSNKIKCDDRRIHPLAKWGVGYRAS